MVNKVVVLKNALGVILNRGDVKFVPERKTVIQEVAHEIKPSLLVGVIVRGHFEWFAVNI